METSEKKKHIGFKAFILAFFIALTALSLICAGLLIALEAVGTKTSSESAAVELGYKPVKEDDVSILLMCCKNDTVAPDLYILLRFAPVERVIHFIPVPAELEATVNITTGTLPELFNYGGVQMTVKAVQNVFRVVVNRYLKINDDAFASLIDQLGGIEYTVDYTVEYSASSSDESASAVVRLEQGKQLFSGKRLLDLINSPLRTSLDEAGQLQFTANLLQSGIEQKFVSSLGSQADTLFKTIANTMQTNLTNYDYTVRKEAIAYVCRSSSEKVAYNLIDGSYTEEKGRKIFTPTPEGIGVVQTWFEVG